MSQSSRARLGTSVVLAATLAVGATAAQSAQAAPVPSDGANFKTRAAAAVAAAAHSHEARAGATLQPSTKALAAAASEAPSALRPADAPTELRRSLAAAAPADCAALNLDWTPTNDHVWLHWDSIGASSYTVSRQRLDGAWKQIGTSTTTSYLDRNVNPRGYVTYRVVAGGLTCDLSDWVTMATGDGWGIPDAVYGGAGANDLMMEQDPYSFAMSTGVSGTDPTFSPDGRLVAASTVGAGSSRRMTVRDLAHPNRAAVVDVAMPADTLGAEAAWSPDGRTISYTRYTVDAQDAVSAPEIHLIDVATGTDRLVAGSAGLVEADWRSPTMLVAAGFEPGQGLFDLPAAGGTRSAVPGTTNAGYPEVAPDGTIWFVTGDGTTFGVSRISPTGTVTSMASSTTAWWERPRLSPDGNLYLIKVERNDPTDPSDNTFTVVENNFDGATVFVTAVGAPRDASLTGFAGYDVRQPKSKGTSDYLGDANNEILGKDTSGRLWGYYSSDASPVAGRSSMGAGWNMFNQVVAAGDLDGDDHADILGRKPDGTLWLYHGLGDGKVRRGDQVGSGWSSYVIVAPGDFNGDGIADLLGRDSRYRLWLYPGKGDGHFGARSLVTSGWGGFSAIIGIGDFNFDGKADILGRERSTGYMYLYPGTGTGAITGRTRVGAGWNAVNAFAAPEFTGLNPGLFGRWADGSMKYYQVIGDGRFDSGSVYPAGAGWKTFQITG